MVSENKKGNGADGLVHKAWFLVWGKGGFMECEGCAAGHFISSL